MYIRNFYAITKTHYYPDLNSVNAHKHFKRHLIEKILKI
jgi:hypothetical protein